MKAILAVFGLVVVVAVSGCGGPKFGVLPSPEVESGDTPENSRVLKKGDSVKLETVSGDIVNGDVVEVTEEYVGLRRHGNFGRKTTQYPAEDISTIELNSGATPGGTSETLLGVTLLLVFVLTLGLFASRAGSGPIGR